MQFSWVLFASCLVICASASAIGYDHEQDQDRFEPVHTVDRESVMQANDKEYLMKNTANLVDLFYETGIPRRIAKVVRGAIMENRSDDPMMKQVNEIFGEFWKQ